MKNLLIPSIGMTMVFILICLPLCLVVLLLEDKGKLEGYHFAAESYINSRKSQTHHLNSDQFFNIMQTDKNFIPSKSIFGQENELYNNFRKSDLVGTKINHQSDLYDPGNTITPNKINIVKLNLLESSMLNMNKVFAFNQLPAESHASGLLNDFTSGEAFKIDALPDEPWAAEVKDEIWILFMFITSFALYKLRFILKFH